MLTRRTFLRALGIGAGVAVVAPELLVPEPEPVRRYWQVGAQLRTATLGDLNGIYKRVFEQTLEQHRAFAESVFLSADHGFTYDPPGPLLVSPKTFRDLESDIEAMRESAVRDIELRLLYGNDVPRTPAGRLDLADSLHVQHVDVKRGEITFNPWPDGARWFYDERASTQEVAVVLRAPIWTARVTGIRSDEKPSRGDGSQGGGVT
jgi:hypothetical protein